MKPAIAERWAQALESGQYRQCHKRMRNGVSPGDYSYCCLGVLTDFYCQETGTPFEDLFPVGQRANDAFECGRIPEPVKLWAGCKGRTIHLLSKTNRTFRTAVELNDHFGFSFKEIAEQIRTSTIETT